MEELSLPEGTDIDSNLRKIWGDEMMDEYNLNSFKIACVESDTYLGLKQKCKTKREYDKELAIVAKNRTYIRLVELAMSTESVRAALNIPFSELSERANLVDIIHSPENYLNRNYSKK
tara:strand:+ start:173 stop:526 length:354 start_codon:yes stop_codon:yes gene_type:complete